MATITKRGDFQWQAKVRARGYPTQSKTFTAKADAQRWARQIESEIERGVFIDRSEAEATSLREVLDRYAREITPAKKGKQQEISLIGRLQVSSLAQRPLAAVRSSDIASWRDARLKEVSPATVSRELCLLSHLFTIAAKDWGMGISNPCAMVRKPKVGNGRARRLNGDEEDRLLAECLRSSPDLQTIAVVAIETAARLGELLKLNWHHVNLDRQTAQLMDTKNGEDRTIPLSSRAVASLQALKLLPRHISGRVFYRWAASDSFNKVWVRACARAGIEDLRFHDLRHEACSRLADRFQMHELMKITGHKSSVMLARYYHPRAEDLAKKLG